MNGAEKPCRGISRYGSYSSDRNVLLSGVSRVCKACPARWIWHNVCHAACTIRPKQAWLAAAKDPTLYVYSLHHMPCKMNMTMLLQVEQQ